MRTVSVLVREALESLTLTPASEALLTEVDELVLVSYICDLDVRSLWEFALLLTSELEKSVERSLPSLIFLSFSALVPR